MTSSPRITPQPLRIEIVAFAGVQLLDVAGPLQVFASTNDWARATDRRPPYEPVVVAPVSPLTCSAGLDLVASSLPSAHTPVDTLLVAGGEAVHTAAREKRLVRWIAARAARARRVGSICSGAFLLAAAGLLDGRRATTHWMVCDNLARRFPAVRVENDPIFVRDGRVWTSAGVTAGIDMALALVQEDLGHPAAIAVARDLVVFLKRPGGQAQFSATLALQHRGGEFDRLHSWMAGHLANDLSISALAARAAMSERSFIRRYRAATGLTPAHAVERMRVEAAQQLLTTTRMPIKRVAQRCGFGSDETFRRSFARQAGTTPNEYRARFAGVSESPSL
jgi:transcriptional regulator GlxA family with amidase domain